MATDGGMFAYIASTTLAIIFIQRRRLRVSFVKQRRELLLKHAMEQLV